MRAPSPEYCATLLRESVNAVFALTCVGLFVATFAVWFPFIVEKMQ
jgi:hypothetical protein